MSASSPESKPTVITRGVVPPDSFHEEHPASIPAPGQLPPARTDSRFGTALKELPVFLGALFGALWLIRRSQWYANFYDRTFGPFDEY